MAVDDVVSLPSDAVRLRVQHHGPEPIALPLPMEEQVVKKLVDVERLPPVRPLIVRDVERTAQQRAHREDVLTGYAHA